MIRSIVTGRLAAAVLAAALGLTGATGCGADAADSTPVVVVTTNILGDVVSELVGDQATVVTLMRPNADPHSFEISAQQVEQMLDADLVVANGLGLEEGLQQHVETADAQGVPVVAAGDFIDPLPYRPDDEDAAGDADVADDPHFWTDPQQMAAVVTGLGKAIGEHVGPIDRAVLQSRIDGYTTELSELDGSMEEQFAALPAQRRTLVTNHHVLGYLARRYGFTVVGTVLPSGTALAAPSASDLDGLAETIRQTGVPAIFADSSQPDRLAQVLADETGLSVTVVPLYTESLNQPDQPAATYLQMMRTNTDRIVAALGG